MAQRTAVWVTGIWLVLASAGAADAAQSGGLAAPLHAGGLSISAGLAYSERDVQDGRDDELASRRALFRVQYGLLDAVNLFATAGFADAQFDGEAFEGSLGGDFGLGAVVELLDFPQSAVRVVADGQVEYFRSTDGGKKLNAWTYQASVYVVKEIGAAGRVGYFYPYAGLRLSYADYDLNRGLDDYESEDVLGLFGGADYFVNPNVFFTGELHVFDETSVYLGVGYRF
ncbi:MAG: hypothetical protein Kow0092_19350 [Deferrisomatales bacterium]